VWRRLLHGLRDRGRDATRESGAFLLGRRVKDRLRVIDFILYDDLDPRCLDSGIIRFDGRHFGKLWENCKQRGLSVVADVHVHPGRVEQSDMDRDHPMISRAGHVALIVGNFAVSPVRRSDIGIYKYKGSKKWDIVPSGERKLFLHIGI
jgi:proteasome lid subunit RPN8/RPN11